MFKKIIFASIFLFANYCEAMLPANLSLEQKVNLRVAAFNDWKKDPGIEQRLNSDQPGTIQAYIHLSMFLKQPEELAKSPDYIAEATQLAQKICPSYLHWPEYYEIFSRTKRGKRYSAEEQMELVLGPTMSKIMRFKMMVVILKGQEITSIQLTPDWKKEIETTGVLKNDLSLITLIPAAIPPKKQELNQLKQEFEQLFDPKNLQAVANREQQKQQRLIQLEQSCSILQQQIELLNMRIQSNTESLHIKEQELERANQRASVSLQEKLAALQDKEAKESEIEQLMERKDRVASTLALFEASKAFGWESSFIQSLKHELGK